MNKRRLKTIAVVLIAAASIVTACLGLFWHFLFRPVHYASGSFGNVTIERSWGNAIQVKADRNLDGVIDFRSHPDPQDPLAVPPFEFWRDDDFDGVFELHIVLGSKSERPARLFEIDGDGDGVFEVKHEWPDADVAYGEWLKKQASINAINPDGSPREKQ